MISTAVQNLVEIRPWGASGQIGEILIYFVFYLYTIFLSNAPTGQTADPVSYTHLTLPTIYSV